MKPITLKTHIRESELREKIISGVMVALITYFAVDLISSLKKKFFPQIVSAINNNASIPGSIIACETLREGQWVKAPGIEKTLTIPGNTPFNPYLKVITRDFIFKEKIVLEIDAHASADYRPRESSFNHAQIIARIHIDGVECAADACTVSVDPHQKKHLSGIIPMHASTSLSAVMEPGEHRVKVEGFFLGDIERPDAFMSYIVSPCVQAPFNHREYIDTRTSGLYNENKNRFTAPSRAAIRNLPITAPAGCAGVKTRSSAPLGFAGTSRKNGSSQTSAGPKGSKWQNLFLSPLSKLLIKPIPKAFPGTQPVTGGFYRVSADDDNNYLSEITLLTKAFPRVQPVTGGFYRVSADDDNNYLSEITPLTKAFPRVQPVTDGFYRVSADDDNNYLWKISPLTKAFPGVQGAAFHEKSPLVVEDKNLEEFGPVFRINHQLTNYRRTTCHVK